MRKLLVEEAAPKGGDDKGLSGARREARERLLHNDRHGDLAPLRVAEAPELAAVAVALAQMRDRVVEEPLAVEGGAAAAHVGELLLRLGVQLFEGVVVWVMQLVQPLCDELVGMQVEGL